MKAVAYPFSAQGGAQLEDVELAIPEVSGSDILVEIKAISVNPVDLKIHRAITPAAGEWKVLGWDAAGVVAEVGPAVTLFKKGDAVWYAGALDRPGCNSEYHVVDQQLAAIMPSTLNFAQAAALPLTGLTAWELLFDRLGVPQGAQNFETTAGPESILIVGGAGGVGSALIQLARQLTTLQVIATASRSATREWAAALGAHVVIDHSLPLAAELKKVGIPSPTYIASLTHTDQHFTQLAEVIAPEGKIAIIDDAKNIDVSLLKRKSVSLHWEFMFTRSLYNKNLAAQHRILTRLSQLVEQGVVHSTQTEHFGFINAENLTRAHQQIATGTTRGKIVLESFAEYF